MGPAVLLFVVLALSVWATKLIVGLDRATTTQKVIYIAIAWLLPILGAVIAYFSSLRFKEPKNPSADEKMMYAVASGHKARKSE